MLLQSLQVALVAGLAFEAAANPIQGVSSRATIRQIPATHILHERSGQHWGRSWQQKHRVPRDAVLPVRIGLQQSGEDVGREALLDM